MNREIKFRGYDNLNKCWRYGSLVKFSNTEYHIQLEASEYLMPEEFGNKIAYCTRRVDMKSFFVQKDSIGQFIGLKDKNGKEVYDGDFFTDDSIVDEYGTPCIAQIGMDRGAWRIVKSNCSCGCVGRVIYDLTEMRTIGNVFQNPELLER